MLEMRALDAIAARYGITPTKATRLNPFDRACATLWLVIENERANRR